MMYCTSVGYDMTAVLVMRGVPHYIIGRITKVLNMKPPEILGMIEEATGTRMFELKKQASQKMIEKKQAKVEEIDKVNQLILSLIVLLHAMVLAPRVQSATV